MPSNDNNLTSVSKRARRIWVQLLAVAVIVAIVAPVRGQVPTSGALSGTRPRHWHKYSNSSCGFSFWYPDPYRPVSLPAPSENDAFRHYEKRLLLLERRDDPGAKIWVSLDVHPFNLHNLWQFHGPTGYDEDTDPPLIRTGPHAFYFYGPGGGGAQYPDSYFLNLKGKILEFAFDGPYEDKSPTGETPELEPKILKTLRIR
jgi:hypothetical protein